MGEHEKMSDTPKKENTFMVIDRFSSLDDLRPKDRSNDEAVLTALKKQKRFSVWEASEHHALGNTLTRLVRNRRLKLAPDSQFPWSDVTEIDGVPIGKSAPAADCPT